MAERSKALVLGTSLFGGVGSNPTPITLPVSLVGQDTWFSPMRPGFESRTGNVFDFFFFLLKKKTRSRAPAGNQTRVSSVAGTYIITILPAPMNSPALSIPRLELGTSRVLGERHDQLDHTDELRGVYGVSGFRSLYLVLAKHARFRLRQYPGCGLRSVPETGAKQCFQEKKNPRSVTGNRTPGICVTGRDVTNYTMTDEGADAAGPSAAPTPGQVCRRPRGAGLVVRSYQGERSASHPNCELKHL